MNLVWLLIFICSGILLCFTLFRKQLNLHWVGYALGNIIIAAVILYVMDLTGLFEEYRIPVNLVTIATVGILGIPGLLLLAAIKVFVI
jgi:inhibitor of the pro-sigma K processing machinery